MTMTGLLDCTANDLRNTFGSNLQSSPQPTSENLRGNNAVVSKLIPSTIPRFYKHTDPHSTFHAAWGISATFGDRSTAEPSRIKSLSWVVEYV